MLGLFISSAVAQEAGAAAAQQPNPIMSMVPLVAIFIIFYFLMIRPQKKKLEAERKQVEGLEKGVEVYTKSGIIGKIHGISDKVMTLEVEGGVKIKFLKSYIAGPVSQVMGKVEEKK
jgi:preprotein translocase subunit YajC